MTEGVVYIVDDDADLGASVARLLHRHGFVAAAFPDQATLRPAHRARAADCLLTDMMLGDDDGFAVAEQLRRDDPHIAILFMTAWPTTAHAVDSIRRHGGLDYLEKPLDESRLLTAVTEGVVWSRRQRAAAERLSTLSQRERQVFDLLVQGHPNKVVAERLGLSPRTVEDHRASILLKTGSKGLAQLISLAQ
ncbi:response regulator transcription factor [Sphingomonas morindae]|uniref:Response regulator n=1 Tax=Sphingomonas morindae TaxID=1541170 RepID=A0ABY4X6Q3_9SPHN|nr:response regulator [Sphingomonas morindae]USI72564.1 response regulator [Sphingomonas morindae]